MNVDDPSAIGTDTEMDEDLDDSRSGADDPESTTAMAEEHVPSGGPATDLEVPEADALEQSASVPYDDDDRR